MNEIASPEILKVSVNNQPAYPIYIGSDILPRLGEWLQPLLSRPKITIIADPNALAAQGEKLRSAIAMSNLEATIMETPTAGEAVKNFAALEELCLRLLDAKLERDDLILSFGGGAIGDLTGLAASLIKRGIACAHIPTTLLSQVDSAIGGKTGINSPQGKNLIGTFHQPRLVLIDCHLTATLPKREFLSGYAEIVKYGIIKDDNFFQWLEKNGNHVIAREPDAMIHAITTSCRVKANIVSQDEKEKGERALLNFGHSFGHALEILTNYNLLHGEAVAIGMVIASQLSAALGFMPQNEVTRITQHLNHVGLPTKTNCLSHPQKRNQLIQRMKQDKKIKKEQLTLILAKTIGQAFIYQQLSFHQLKDFLNGQKIL